MPLFGSRKTIGDPCTSKATDEIVKKLCCFVKHRKAVKSRSWYGRSCVNLVPSQESWLAADGYFLGDSIATGSCSSVVRAADDIFGLGRAAVKIVNLRHMKKWGMGKMYIRCNIREEWRKLKHPNIIVLHDVIIGRHRAFCIMQFACCGDAQQFIQDDDRFKAIFPLTIRRWCWQIIMAIKYLHKQDVVHGNLKLENVLLNCKLNVKLSDIGFAWIRLGKIDSDYKSPCGCTKAYAAPELLCGQVGNEFAVDIWAMGVIFFALWNRCLPFPGHASKYAIVAIQKKGIIPWKIGNIGPVDPLANDMVKGILKLDPCDRPTANDLTKSELFKWKCK